MRQREPKLMCVRYCGRELKGDQCWGVNKLLSAKDDRERSVWYVAAETESSEELEQVWEWAKNGK